MKKIITVILAAVFIGALLGLAAVGVRGLIRRDSLVSDMPIGSDRGDLNGCYVAELFPYSGEASDGSGVRQVNGAAAIRIVNNSPLNIRWAEISVKTESGDYTFLAVSWLAGSRMTVLDTELRSLPEEYTFVSAQITALELFEETPSLHEDSLDLVFADGMLTAANLTDEEITDITVYFKTCEANGILGGVTYKLDIPSVPAGGEISVRADTDTAKELEAIFVTFG